MTHRFSTAALMDEAARELAARRHVYPRLVANGGLSQQQADHRMALMAEIHARLLELSANEQPSLPLPVPSQIRPRGGGAHD
jgi:hypothetical protein